MTDDERARIMREIEGQASWVWPSPLFVSPNMARFLRNVGGNEWFNKHCAEERPIPIGEPRHD